MAVVAFTAHYLIASSGSDSDVKDEKGPASVPVEDAIAWGRANASTVIVMVCDDSGGAARFSAGDVAPEECGFPADAERG